MRSDSLNLTDWLAEEAEKPGSTVADFLNFFTVEFVLDNLGREDQKIFLAKIMVDDEEALNFAALQIPDFEQKFKEALAKKTLILRKELWETNAES